MTEQQRDALQKIIDIANASEIAVYVPIFDQHLTPEVLKEGHYEISHIDQLILTPLSPASSHPLPSHSRLKSLKTERRQHL